VNSSIYVFEADKLWPALERIEVTEGVLLGNYTRVDVVASPALPPVDWYEALGHDAALLARAALQGFSDGRVDDGRVVRELHARAERALGTAEAPLWTTDSRGFSEARVLARTLTIVSPNSPPPRAP